MIDKRISSGIKGLNYIIKGGFIPNRCYLVRGKSGTGKSTLGINFLLEGVKEKESVLYITLEESEKKIKENFKLRGIDLNCIDFLDISPNSDYFSKIKAYDLFSAAEVEREPITNAIIEKVKLLKPNRVFLDSITQFKYLSPDLYQFRKMVLSFFKYLIENNVTLLFTSEISEQMQDDDVKFISDGVIKLDYDGLTRTIQVEKFRGSEFIEGKHTLKFSEKGIEVFPKISIMGRKETFKKEFISSGVNEIDKMLAGGIEKGTITIISGPSGTGKTTLTLSFLKEIALSGRSAFFFSFEEETDLLLARCEAINMNLRDKSLKDNLKLFKFAPKNNSIEEFYKILNDSLEKFKAEIVAIDSISSFENCFLSQDFKKDLYLICKNLQNSGITVFLVNEKESIAEDFSITSKGFSSMADNIIILNYIEIDGEIRKTIGVLKKRVSDFEKIIRQFEVTKDGIKVSKPLKNLKGILTGVPEKIKSRK